MEVESLSKIIRDRDEKIQSQSQEIASLNEILNEKLEGLFKYNTMQCMG